MDRDIIASKYAEAFLTKNNELQFRFKINENYLKGEDMFKVKVNIHDEKLAAALGTEEIIYGEEEVLNGEYLEVKEDGGNYILMDPLPLNIDFHIAELEKMIAEGDAVSIEVFNGKEVFGRGYLSNFSSEL
ncbi:hypothetical protein [Bacillus sp. FJAT-27245]|uniref:hypothetical protein n=1 Tax=Bacillus sp. FJAT-27245 TaxID=1684144 RepID=UPI001E28AE24|nr:hypothetical protein [Bacillus sp. FJAT-27245]